MTRARDFFVRLPERTATAATFFVAFVLIPNAAGQSTEPRAEQADSVLVIDVSASSPQPDAEPLVKVDAKSVVLVVDYSGSVVPIVYEIKKAIRRVLAELGEDVSIGLILCYGDVRGAGNDRYPVDAFAKELQPATDEVERELFDWLDRKSPQGGTLPVPAMRRALACRPEAIIFLTDGEFQDSFVDEITLANDGNAQIHCLVLDENILTDRGTTPPLTDGAKRLKRLAELNKGKTKIVTGADLRR